jgi:hypothetical protein
MFNLSNYTNMIQSTFTPVTQENFQRIRYGSGTIEFSKKAILLGLMIDLIVAYLFMMFAYTYINKIHPTLTIEDKTIYLVLVYIIFISHALVFVSDIVYLSKIICL